MTEFVYNYTKLLSILRVNDLMILVVEAQNTFALAVTFREDIDFKSLADFIYDTLNIFARFTFRPFDLLTCFCCFAIILCRFL